MCGWNLVVFALASTAATEFYLIYKAVYYICSRNYTNCVHRRERRPALLSLADDADDEPSPPPLTSVWVCVCEPLPGLFRAVHGQDA